MDKLSLREAVKHFAVSRPTLSKALKSGKISGVQDGKGGWTIDPAELARVYPARLGDVVKLDNGLAGHLPSVNSHNSVKIDELVGIRAELAAALQRAAVAEALADEREKRIEDLRRMLPAPDTKPRRWWPW